MANETERGQLIPPSFRVANKVVAAHYWLTFLNSLESTGDLQELTSLNLWLKVCSEKEEQSNRKLHLNQFKTKMQQRINLN